MGNFSVRDLLTIRLSNKGTDAARANRSSELQQGVGVIVVECGQGLTVCTEVEVMANGASVAVTDNVALGGLALAQWAITEDTCVDNMSTRLLFDIFIERGKSVTRMGFINVLEALSTVVPVRASKTFVTDAMDLLNEVSMEGFPRKRKVER